MTPEEIEVAFVDDYLRALTRHTDCDLTGHEGAEIVEELAKIRSANRPSATPTTPEEG